MLNKPPQKLQKYFWEVRFLYFWEELLSETFPINQEPQDNISAKIKENVYTLRIYICINGISLARERLRKPVREKM